MTWSRSQGNGPGAGSKSMIESKLVGELLRASQSGPHWEYYDGNPSSISSSESTL